MAKRKTKRKSATKTTGSKRTTARSKTTKRAGAKTTRTTTTKRAKTRAGTRTTTRKTSKTTTTKTAALKKLPTTVKEPMSKSTMIKAITEATGLKKADVTSVLTCLEDVIKSHVKPGAAGKFVMPGIAKFEVKKKPARPARKGINPFTGEEIMIKAKKASKAVKIRPLKKLKEMVTP